MTFPRREKRRVRLPEGTSSHRHAGACGREGGKVLETGGGDGGPAWRMCFMPQVVKTVDVTVGLIFLAQKRRCERRSPSACVNPRTTLPAPQRSRGAEVGRILPAPRSAPGRACPSGRREPSVRTALNAPDRTSGREPFQQTSGCRCVLGAAESGGAEAAPAGRAPWTWLCPLHFQGCPVGLGAPRLHGKSYPDAVGEGCCVHVRGRARSLSAMQAVTKDLPFLLLPPLGRRPTRPEGWLGAGSNPGRPHGGQGWGLWESGPPGQPEGPWGKRESGRPPQPPPAHGDLLPAPGCPGRLLGLPSTHSRNLRVSRLA